MYQPTFAVTGFVQTGFERKLQQETDEKMAVRRHKQEHNRAWRQRKLQHVRAQQYLL